MSFYADALKACQTDGKSDRRKAPDAAAAEPGAEGSGAGSESASDAGDDG